MPRDTASLAEAARTLTVLVGRERRREMVERLAQRAGVDLSAAASWLIVRLHEDPSADIPALCRSFEIPVQTGEHALSELVDRSLVTVSPVIAVTPEGEAIAARLLDERRASLKRLCEDWSPDENPDLGRLVSRLASELLREPSAEVGAPA